MSTADPGAVRSRLALELLAAADKPVPRAELWSQVVEHVPLSTTESEVHSNGSSRGATAWAWITAEFVKAGWLIKDRATGWSITAEGREALDQESSPDGFRSEARNRYAAWSRSRDAERSAALPSGIVPLDASQEEVLHAAALFVERGLNNGDSVFSPGRAIWTKDIADELVRVFVDSDGKEGEGFLGKVAVQLANASEDARLLMAELVTLQLLPANIATIGEKAKRERITVMLNLMKHAVRIPAEVDRAFGFGSFNPGTRMASALGAAMTILVGFVAAWTALEAEKREELLADPWAMRELVRGIDGERFPSQRHALLYLTHPQTFVSIISEDHKEAIRDAFVNCQQASRFRTRHS